MSRYRALTDHLAGLHTTTSRMTYPEIESLVGPLPASAQNHRAWWANDKTHSHATAWLAAGWRVDEVRLGHWVRFVRHDPQPRGSEAGAPKTSLRAALPDNLGSSERSPGLIASAATTLLVLPCSSRKLPGGERPTGTAGVLESLSGVTRRRLQEARAANRQRAGLNDAQVMTAYKRYAGTLYSIAGESIGRALHLGWSCVILSGGYGVVSADEEIGMYDARFEVSRWSPGLIGAVVTEYAIARGLSDVLAVVGRSTPYAEVLRRYRWSDQVRLRLAAPTVRGGGAMVKTPRAIGETVRDVVSGGLAPGWTSSDGVPINVATHPYG